LIAEFAIRVIISVIAAVTSMAKRCNRLFPVIEF